MVERERKNQIWSMEKKAKGRWKEAQKVFMVILNCFGRKKKQESRSKSRKRRSDGL